MRLALSFLMQKLVPASRLLLFLLFLWLAGGWLAASAQRAHPPISGVECLRVLQEARRSGLPFQITEGDAAYQAMWDWDQAEGLDKAQVIEELITWLPVLLKHSQTVYAENFEYNELFDLHPAADVLRNVKSEATGPLERRLLADSEPAQAKWIALLLQRFSDSDNDAKHTRLLSLKARTNSPQLKTLIDQVDRKTKRPVATEADKEEEVVVQTATPKPNLK